MKISLVGINYQTAPITVREKAAITAEGLYDSLLLLRSRLAHGIILSTCNRTEVYTTDSDGHHAEEASLDFLRFHLGIPEAELARYVYFAQDEAAVEHLFRVACGLDSMIIGEFEILGQVGHALEVAEKAKMVTLPLRRIFQSAIRAGRQAREETGISKNALSVSSVAVDLAANVVGSLQNCKVLVIGAGEAGWLVAKAVKERGISRIAVASRTRERAAALAAVLGGVPISLNNLVEELGDSDIVVTCAGAPRRILDVNRVEATMKTRQAPLVIIDIAVPRNVEPAVGRISNVFLYNIDDLTQISELNRQQREEEIRKVTEIIMAAMAKFSSWWQALEVRPILGTLMKKAEDIRRTQLEKTLSKLPPLTDEEREHLEAMTKSIVTKILKEPASYLKANADNSREYAEMVSKLFRLDQEKR